MWCDLGTEARVMSVFEQAGLALREPAASTR
jgi:hypothetical protein